MNDLVARGEGAGLAIIPWASALLYNGLGRYEEARLAAQQAGAYPRVAVLRVGAGGADRGRGPQREPELAADALRRLSETTQRSWHRLGAGDRGPLARAAQRRRGRRAPLPRGDRAARPHPHPRGARSHPPPLRRMAATQRRRLDPPASSCAAAHQLLARSAWTRSPNAPRGRARGHRRAPPASGAPTLADHLTAQEAQISAARAGTV